MKNTHIDASLLGVMGLVACSNQEDWSCPVKSQFREQPSLQGLWARKHQFEKWSSWVNLLCFVYWWGTWKYQNRVGDFKALYALMMDRTVAHSEEAGASLTALAAGSTRLIWTWRRNGNWASAPLCESMDDRARRHGTPDATVHHCWKFLKRVSRTLKHLKMGTAPSSAKTQIQHQTQNSGESDHSRDVRIVMPRWWAVAFTCKNDHIPKQGAWVLFLSLLYECLRFANYKNRWHMFIATGCKKQQLELFGEDPWWKGCPFFCPCVVEVRLKKGFQMCLGFAHVSLVLAPFSSWFWESSKAILEKLALSGQANTQAEVESPLHSNRLRMFSFQINDCLAQ